MTPTIGEKKKPEVIQTDWLLRQGLKQSRLWMGAKDDTELMALYALQNLSHHTPSLCGSGDWTQNLVSPRQVLYCAPDYKVIFKVMKPLRDSTSSLFCLQWGRREHRAVSQTFRVHCPASSWWDHIKVTSLFPHLSLKQNKRDVGRYCQWTRASHCQRTKVLAIKNTERKKPLARKGQSDLEKLLTSANSQQNL